MRRSDAAMVSAGTPYSMPTLTLLSTRQRGARDLRIPVVIYHARHYLHMTGVEKLIGVPHRLVDAGNTVVVIEHNLDVIANADWVINLGPEGGDAGGRIVAQGAPAAIIMNCHRSHTTRLFAEFLAERGV